MHPVVVLTQSFLLLFQREDGPKIVAQSLNLNKTISDNGGHFLRSNFRKGQNVLIPKNQTHCLKIVTPTTFLNSRLSSPTKHILGNSASMKLLPF